VNLGKWPCQVRSTHKALSPAETPSFDVWDQLLAACRIFIDQRALLTNALPRGWKRKVKGNRQLASSKKLLRDGSDSALPKIATLQSTRDMEQELIAAVAGFVGGHGGRFLDEILKPTAALMGDDLANRYRSWRARNIAEVLDAAVVMLDASGLPPAPVPGRLLFPILEHASVEENEELRRRWSSLLANSATARLQDRLLPGYAEVLRQLMPVHVGILDWLYEQKEELAPGQFNWRSLERNEIQSHFGFSDGDYALLITDLHRLLLIRPSGTQFRDVWEPVYREVALTTFGLTFVRCCHPPEDRSHRK